MGLSFSCKCDKRILPGSVLLYNILQDVGSAATAAGTPAQEGTAAASDCNPCQMFCGSHSGHASVVAVLFDVVRAPRSKKFHSLVVIVSDARSMDVAISIDKMNL